MRNTRRYMEEKQLGTTKLRGNPSFSWQLERLILAPNSFCKVCRPDEGKDNPKRVATFTDYLYIYLYLPCTPVEPKKAKLS